MIGEPRAVTRCAPNTSSCWQNVDPSSIGVHMKRSTDRILTTHTGSLPRPDDLLDIMREKENQRPYDRARFSKRVHEAVVESVRRQCDIGIDIPSDGEQSKSGFGSYQA